MRNTRIIARLDVKPPYLIKPVGLDGVRKVGDPVTFTKKYISEGIDELLYLDSVASLYGINSTASLVSEVASCANIPISVGGGLRSLDDVELMMRSGADKVVLNSAVSDSPDIISKAANRYGSQSVVISLQARYLDGHFAFFKNSGRDLIVTDPIHYLAQIADLGAGEIMVTCIDNDGRMSGMDYELLHSLYNHSTLPFIASSGLKNTSCLEKLFRLFIPEAIAVGASLHYSKVTITDLKSTINSMNVSTRSIDI